MSATAIYAFLLGAIFAAFAIDTACENVTGERCSFGVPNAEAIQP